MPTDTDQVRQASPGSNRRRRSVPVTSCLVTGPTSVDRQRRAKGHNCHGSSQCLSSNVASRKALDERHDVAVRSHALHSIPFRCRSVVSRGAGALSPSPRHANVCDRHDSRISSVNTFGFPREHWAAAKAEARAAMIECARNEKTLSYTQLVSKISSIQLEPHDVRLDRLLESVARGEDLAGRGILTVVVVHKTGDMRPGLGFFEIAEQLGRDVSDRDACWIAELNNVYAQWC